ncbi:MAG: DNA damage-inducible protein D [Candidatus Cloacimonetes bacterium]|nr:DNA damage-inducible protein D [Candidatus Cloacimonadota bacterium]
MKQEQIMQLQEQFDKIRETLPETDIEFWFARDLQKILGYERWENFSKTILKATEACKQSAVAESDHFRGVTKMVPIGSGAERPLKDIMLTRYACYLIAQNGDSRKEQIAFAQTYFALQTRKAELIEERLLLNRRMQARKKLRESETELSKNIYERGVDDQGFGRIRSKGDSALFGGKTTKQMKAIMQMPDYRPLADFLPTVTIAAKNLATEITNHNVEENDLIGEDSITHEHIQNNKSVRKMLLERGVVPEKLSAEEDLKKLERRVKSSEKKMIKESKLPKDKK